MAVIDALTKGPLVLVGSSMGGWIAGLAALARPERLAGLVLVAPAPDLTQALIWEGFGPEQRRVIAEDGIWHQPSEQGGRYPISRALIEEGRRWLLLPGPVPIGAPVRILQGGADAQMLWRRALSFHRLSRPANIARLTAAVEALAG